MADQNGDDQPGPRMILALEMREHENGTEIAMMRIPRDGTVPAIPEDAWTHRFGSREAARRIFLIMMQNTHRWAAWTRMAQLLGADFLAGVIEAEIVAAAPRTEPMLVEEASAVSRPDPEAIADELVQVWLVLGGGRPRIVGSRGGRRFLLMSFETTVDARRVWDWVRWQAHLYEGWYRLTEAAGMAALVQHIAQAVITDERLFGSRPPGTGRPLRNWRPRPREDG